MASLTVENYLKTIHQICSRTPDGPAATGVLAEKLGVSPGTVTSMLKTLSEGGLATYTPYEGVRLTPQGNALALRVLRRHPQSRLDHNRDSARSRSCVDCGRLIYSHGAFT